MSSRPTKRGASAVEFALLAGLVAVVALAAVRGAGDETANLIDQVGNEISATAGTFSAPASGTTPIDPVDADNTSCKTILDSGGSTGDGVYTIDPDGDGGAAPFDVYCDMTVDGGGWIKLRMATSASNSNTFWWKKSSDFCDHVSSYTPWAQLSTCPSGQFDAINIKSMIQVENQTIHYHRWDNASAIYSRNQILALHDLIADIHPDTELTTHTSDDDGCDPNGELFLQIEADGAEFHATPFTSGQQESVVGKYRAADLPSPAYLLPTHIDFGDYDAASNCGGASNGSFGYEANFILVR